MPKHRKLWSEPRIADPRYPGLTVRVTELRKGGNLYVVWKWKDRRPGPRAPMRSLQRTRTDLGATEKEQRDAARAIGLDFMPTIVQETTASPAVVAPAVKSGEVLTLGRLADQYELRGSLTASESYRKEQTEKLRRIAKHLGADKPVVSLSQSDVNTWITFRREGDKRVRQSTIWGEIAALKIALNWAVSEKAADGAPLLNENPLAKVRVEKEKQPRRPVADGERYAALKRVAPAVSSVFDLALDLAWGTGHRIGAIVQLRWHDVVDKPEKAAELAKDLDSQFGWTKEDFPFGGIHFYAWMNRSTNKAHAHMSPMTTLVRDAVDWARAAQSAIAGAWVFADPRDPSKPLTRWMLNRWLRQAERRAKLPHLKHGAWHPFRRGWATARKHHPHMDVAKLGGWMDVTTMEQCYQQADAQTIRAIVKAG